MTSASLSPTLSLAMDLVSQPSVTPDDHGCNRILIERLQALGFETEELNFGEVKNFWARYGNKGPILCFAGHTDVVPSGPEDKWQSPPFVPSIRDGRLYGRGSADMKGSLAAMVTACERYIAECISTGRQPAGSIAYLITSDEEGPARDGTRRVMEHLQERGQHIDYCLIGEPSSRTALGDTIKTGRRGSLHGHLTFHGVQGHIAYPHLASNPVHLSLAPLRALCEEQWDQGNNAFPPTSFQISNIQAGTGADNVIPGDLWLRFNFRFSTELTETDIMRRTEAILDRFDVPYTVDWTLSGLPFLTEESPLIDAVCSSILAITGINTEKSTSGGTSDGRFIAPSGTHVVELGPCNASIHKIDEHVNVADLDQLSLIYEDVLLRMLR